LRAAENVINQIAKGTLKRPGKITKIQPEEEVIAETCCKSDDDNEANQGNLINTTVKSKKVLYINISDD
jgi:hypothetical protein